MKTILISVLTLSLFAAATMFPNSEAEDRVSTDFLSAIPGQNSNDCDAVLEWGRTDQIKFDKEIMQHYAMDRLIREGASSSKSSASGNIAIPDIVDLGFDSDSEDKIYQYLNQLRVRYDYTHIERFLKSNYQSSEAIQAWLECMKYQPLRIRAEDLSNDRYELAVGWGDPVTSKPLIDVDLQVSSNAEVNGSIPTNELIGDHELLLVRKKGSEDYRAPIDIVLKGKIKDGPQINKIYVIPPKPEPLVAHAVAFPLSTGYNQSIGPTQFRYTGEKDGFLIVYFHTRATNEPTPYWSVHPSIRITQIQEGVEAGDEQRKDILLFGPPTRHGNRDEFMHLIVKPNTLLEISGHVNIANGSGKLAVLLTNNLTSISQ